MNVSAGYFEAVYHDSDGPWSLATRWSEQHKYALTPAAPPRARCSNAFEPGAVAVAADRLRDRDDARAEHPVVPEQRPEVGLDVAARSESVYYFYYYDYYYATAEDLLGRAGACLACAAHHEEPDSLLDVLVRAAGANHEGRGPASVAAMEGLGRPPLARPSRRCCSPAGMGPSRTRRADRSARWPPSCPPTTNRTSCRAAWPHSNAPPTTPMFSLSAHPSSSWWSRTSARTARRPWRTATAPASLCPRPATSGSPARSEQRAVGILEREGCRDGEIWLAYTDADTLVPPDRLARHLAHAAEGWSAVLGTVQVEDWSSRPPGTEAEFERLESQVPENERVHGANLGVRAHVYRQAGGFPALAGGEDHALAASPRRLGFRVKPAHDMTVTTSARVSHRVAGGFSDHLTRAAPKA
jgi:hypothetical protein